MIEYLEWDSDFFKKKIGKISGDNVLQLVDLIKDSYDLVYVFSQNLNLDFNLVDEKVIYLISDLDKISVLDTKVSIFNPLIDSYQELLSLAIQSAKYSRFKLDSNFHNEDYKRLYQIWIDKYIKKNVNNDIAIIKRNNKIVAFASLEYRNNLPADIGLVAVDENYRGQGLGKMIMNSVLLLAKGHGIKQIQVVTQLKNIAANKLYKNSGFKEESITYIYHIWNK